MKKSLLLALLLGLLTTGIANAASPRLERLARKITDQAEELKDATFYGSRREMRTEMRELANMLDRYKTQLAQGNGGGGGGPIHPPTSRFTANCEVDVGGNFFTPKTQIKCTINGIGAAFYDVKVNGRVKWHGGLSSNQARTSFETDKKKVGGYGVSYTVFVIDKRGRQHQVFSKMSRY